MHVLPIRNIIRLSWFGYLGIGALPQMILDPKIKDEVQEHRGQTFQDVIHLYRSSE